MLSSYHTERFKCRGAPVALFSVPIIRDIKSDPCLWPCKESSTQLDTRIEPRDVEEPRETAQIHHTASLT
jgi:hypothetical protein